MTDELIRDQLIVQCRDKKVQERLWAAKNPSLKDAINMAKVIEQSQLCMRELNKRDEISTATVQHSNTGEDDVNVASKSTAKTVRKKNFPFRRCFRCGSPTHSADNKTCPAIDTFCHKCGHKGHFITVCRNSTRYNVAAVSSDLQTMTNPTYTHSQDHVLCIGSSDNMHRPRPTATFHIHDKPVELMVDSGSMYTIIPSLIFNQNWPHITLLPKDIDACGYQGQTIHLLGYMKVNIKFEDRQIHGKVSIRWATHIGLDTPV